MGYCSPFTPITKHPGGSGEGAGGVQRCSLSQAQLHVCCMSCLLHVCCVSCLPQVMSAACLLRVCCVSCLLRVCCMSCLLRVMATCHICMSHLLLCGNAAVGAEGFQGCREGVHSSSPSHSDTKGTVATAHRGTSLRITAPMRRPSHRTLQICEASFPHVSVISAQCAVIYKTSVSNPPP